MNRGYRASMGRVLIVRSFVGKCRRKWLRNGGGRPASIVALSRGSTCLVTARKISRLFLFIADCG